MGKKAFTTIWHTPINRGANSQAFTLVELLVSVAIISLLIALIIPNIDRSLSKNNLSNDVELFKAKLEETRLLSGSTQQIDEYYGDAGSTSQDATGYYGILLHRGARAYFSIVRLSYPIAAVSACMPANVITQAENQSGECFIERVNLTPGVKTAALPENFFIVYRTPVQELSKVVRTGGGWIVDVPTFPTPLFQLTYESKTAKVDVDDYTGRVTVQYEN